jgi:cold shock CspA family protein
VPELRMRVSKYLPEKLYGFCQDETGTEVFFHLGCFHPGALQIPPNRCSSCPGLPHCHLSHLLAPPPILGEEVVVVFEHSDASEKAPRAARVDRVSSPVMLLGIVESFDPVRRYGFVQGTDQVSYHLHQSEIVNGRLPLVGNSMTFFAGVREGRPRACHVRVCR